MEHDKEKEGRRSHRRYPLSQMVSFEVSAPLTFQESHHEEAAGSTQNVSEGGLCLITKQALEEAQIIKIKLPIPNVDATTPTLAEVRWVKRDLPHRLASLDKQSDTGPSVFRPPAAGQDRNQYLVGLRFLF